MKTFKSFISKPKVEQDSDGYDVLNTTFGTHITKPDDTSKVEKDKDGYDVLNTTFGKHSIEESVSEDHEELSKHYHKFTKSDKDAIGDYTGESFHINNYLHKRAINQRNPHSTYMQKRVDGLNAALRRHKNT